MAAPLNPRRPSVSALEIKRRRIEEARLDHLARVLCMSGLRQKFRRDTETLKNLSDEMKAALRARYRRSRKGK